MNDHLYTYIKSSEFHTAEFKVLNDSRPVDRERFIELFKYVGRLAKPGQRISIEDTNANIMVAVKAKSGYTYDIFMVEHESFINMALNQQVFKKEK